MVAGVPGEYPTVARDEKHGFVEEGASGYTEFGTVDARDGV